MQPYNTPYNYGPNYYMSNPYSYYGSTPALGMTQRVESSARSMTQWIENILQAITGFTNLIDGTYYAGAASFSAVLSLLNYLRDSKSNIYTVLEWIYRKFWMSFLGIQHDKKKLDKWIPIASTALLASLVIYVLTKAIKALQQETQSLTYNSLVSPVFAQVTHDYNKAEASDLSLCKGELVAITHLPAEKSLKDMKNESMWICGRKKDGEIGYFPSNYVELLLTQASA